MFDNRGETAWETQKTDTLCTLEFDLGKLTTLTALSLAEKGQIEGWNHGCDIRLKTRASSSAEWQQVIRHQGAIGAPPILQFAATSARFVKLEIRKRPSFELQIAELRVFGPIN